MKTVLESSRNFKPANDCLQHSSAWRCLDLTVSFWPFQALAWSGEDVRFHAFLPSQGGSLERPQSVSQRTKINGYRMLHRSSPVLDLHRRWRRGWLLLEEVDFGRSELWGRQTARDHWTKPLAR